MLGGGAVAGALVVRKGVQMLLGDKNVGAMGYAADAVAAIALAWATAKFAGGELAKGVLAGGISATMLRIWSDNVSQLTAPAAVSGLGDVEFSSNGLGAYVASAFPLPTHSVVQGNYITSPTSEQLANAAAAAAGSMAPPMGLPAGPTSGVSRFNSRFA